MILFLDVRLASSNMLLLKQSANWQLCWTPVVWQQRLSSQHLQVTILHFITHNILSAVSTSQVQSKIFSLSFSIMIDFSQENYKVLYEEILLWYSCLNNKAVRVVFTLAAGLEMTEYLPSQHHHPSLTTPQPNNLQIYTLTSPDTGTNPLARTGLLSWATNVLPIYYHNQINDIMEMLGEGGGGYKGWSHAAMITSNFSKL